MSGNLERKVALLNRLHRRKAFIESIKGRELAALPVVEVRALKSEYVRVCERIERLERRLR
jgi:hypothetical protein